MSSIRVSGNTSGYYDLTVPDIAGNNTLPINQIVTTDTNGHLQITGGSTNNDDSAAIITAAATEHAKIRIDTSSTSNHRATLALESGSYEVDIATSGLDEIRFSTQNTSDALFIGSNGRIGIGTTGPIEGLEVFGDSGADNMALKYSGTSGGHKSGYLWKDFRGQTNAGIYNYLLNDGVGTTAADMEFYTSNAGTLTKQMEINKLGYITKPNQPSFHAYPLSGATNNWTGSSGSIVPFDAVTLNVGSHYNTSNYRFTCPVGGVYFFYYRNTSNTWYGDIGLYVNGTQWVEMEQRETHTTWRHHFDGVLVSCSTNDYIDIRVESTVGGSATIDGNARYWDGFGGYLVC